MKKIKKYGETTIRHNCIENDNIINLILESGKLDEFQFGDEEGVVVIGIEDIKAILNKVGFIIVKNIERKYDFNLNEVEAKRLEKWQKKIKKKNNGMYGSYTFKFTPTGVGDNITVRSNLTKKEKDITDYDSW